MNVLKMNGNLFGGGDLFSFLLFLVFLYFYPKLYLWQILNTLESELVKLEEYAIESQNDVVKKIKKLKGKKGASTVTLRKKISAFMDFFAVSPVDIDPYGILNKIEHITKLAESRIERFVSRIAEIEERDSKKNVKFGLLGAMSVVMIYKIMRHYVETIKRTNNIQLGLIIQMMLPEIMKAAKANLKATKAFLDGIPIGDGIGPLVATMMKSKEGEEIEPDVVVSKEKIDGKDVFVLKAKGKGAEISQTKMWRAIEKIVKKEKIKHIISIDASLKLEGEKTGSVAEGVGFVMSPYGVDRPFVEEIATKHGIELDGVIIKMSDVEASIPMKREIYRAAPVALEKVKELIKLSPHRNILVVGVGNTCGVGNSADEVRNLEKVLKPVWRVMKKEEEEERKKAKRWFPPVMGM